MSRDRAGRIYCDCAAPVHFADAADLTEGRYGENHRAGANCTHVIRANVGGALICSGCWKAGHGDARHPDAIERFHAKQPRHSINERAEELAEQGLDSFCQFDLGRGR